MGKRKLNKTTFFQCEWTGFPMRAAHCYMPTWNTSGKLVKRGSYCNWEAVAAHAHHLLGVSELNPTEHLAILDHIEFITGTHVEVAPHYDELLHTKGRLSATDFHTICARQAGPITGVKITPNGEVLEIILQPDSEGVFKFDAFMHKPYNSLAQLSTFHSMRKKGASKATERDLTVWYYATKDLPHNAAASNLFKMQLYGDVLLIQQSRESSFLPRERYVSFNKQQFDDMFKSRKKAKHVDATAMSSEAYNELKAVMQQSLNSYEQKASSKAMMPKEHSKGMTMAPTSGKKLANAVRERMAAKAAQDL